MTTAMAMASVSSLPGLELGCNSTTFIALRGTFPLRRGVGIVSSRRRQRTTSAGTVNAVISKVAFRENDSCHHKTTDNRHCQCFWLTNARRGCLVPRASYEDDIGLPEDAIPEEPIYQPEYYSYNDPNTGEPAPTYGIRTPLPDRQFWNEDMIAITRSTEAATPFETSRIELNEDSEKRKKSGGRRRRNDSLPRTEAQLARAKEEEAENEALLQSLKEKFSSDDDGKEKKGMQDVESDDEEEEEEREDDEKDSKFFDMNSKNAQEPTAALATIDKGEVDLTESDTPLTNDELWWNWRKPPPDQKPWSAWQKRAGDSDTVMAAAMAETGQIDLFGEKPTIAEATLARARKRVFYAERTEAEEARKKEIGAMAYYKEWVKHYKEDVSKEAVQRRYDETGEAEGLQLLEMFAHQTTEEYRIMQGTDIRIQRDPLIMRMREEQIKQVWGGDPVYPTVNYERDPDEIADYRNANMHEPIPDIVEMLRESGRLITQEEVKKLQDLEKAQEFEFAEDDMLSGAVDIGDDEENDEEDEEEDIEPATSKTVVMQSPRAKKSKPTRNLSTGSDEGESKVEVLDEEDDEEEELEAEEAEEEE